MRFSGSPKSRVPQLAVVCCCLWLACCSMESDPGRSAPSDPAPDTSGSGPLFTFFPDSETFLGGASPFPLPEKTPLPSALDALGRRLAGDYFDSPPENVRFELIGIHRIPGPGRDLRVGVVDMVDPDRIAERFFFQGSSGGQTTYCMIAATFLQPTRSPPLLDGLVLLYNGEPMPEYTHVRLQGILTPSQVAAVADRAVRFSQRRRNLH